MISDPARVRKTIHRAAAHTRFLCALRPVRKPIPCILVCSQPGGATVATHSFDDSNITWNRLGDLEYLHYSILSVDESNRIAEVLFKFAANEKIVLHRHKAHNNTFVVQGEHRLYKPDGSLKEVRRVGSMTCSAPDIEPHREGGGDQDAIVMFSIRGDGVLYELMDDEQNQIGTITFQDLVDLSSAA